MNILIIIIIIIIIIVIRIIIIIIIIITMSWIRSRVSLALLRSAFICLRGSRTLRRIQLDIKNADIDIETEEGAI